MITIDLPSSDHTAPLPFFKSSLTRFLNRACRLLDLPPSVSVLLTGDAAVKQLNRTYRRKNKPTDVLSFPAEQIPGLPPQHQPAGDLAISVDIAARQAEQFGHPLEIELRILILHGLLHLAGFDHEVDHGEMAARELDLRQRLKLPNGLIGRATSATPPRRSRSRA